MKAKIFSVIIGILLVSVTGMAYQTANTQQSGDIGQQDEPIIKGDGVSSISKISIGRDNSIIYVVDKNNAIYRVDTYNKKIEPIKKNNGDDLIFSGGEITSFVAIKGSYPWDFVFAAIGKIFAWEPQSSQLIKISNTLEKDLLKLNDKIKAVYQDKKNHKLYAISEGDKVYTLSSNAKDSHVWVESRESAIVLNEYKEDNKVMEKAIAEIRKSTPNATCAAADNSSGKTYVGMKGGQMKLTRAANSSYYSSLPANQVHPFNFNVTYVAPALGPVSDNKAIYRVDITENKYTADQLFDCGKNGFGYTIFTGNDNSVDNQSEIYPINGVKYDGTDGSLTLRPLSFQCIGSDNATNSDSSCNAFNLTDHSYMFSNSTFKNGVKVNGADISAGTPLVNHEDYATTSAAYKDYTLAASFAASETTNPELYTNGVCALPVLITINKKVNNVTTAIPGSDPVYDKLVFFAEDTSGNYNNNNLIGCNPFNDKCNNLAILPADSVEIGGKYVKYGYPASSSSKQSGKVFYLFKKDWASSCKIKVGLITKYPVKSNGDHWILSPCNELPAMTLNSNDVLLSIDGQLNSWVKRTIQLTDNDAVSKVKVLSGSNWIGDSKGNNGGYLDYRLSSIGKDGKGVYVYFPEGLNTRDIDARKDIRSSSMTIGYYAEPIPDTNNPLIASSYSIEDMTAYCRATKGQILYVMLFDRYGRLAQNTSKLKDSPFAITTEKSTGRVTNSSDDLWKRYDDWYHRNDTAWKYINTVIWVMNRFNYPIIFNSVASNHSLGGLTNGGVFVPGNSIRYDFLSNMAASYDLFTSRDDGEQVVNGMTILNKPLFQNKLGIDFVRAFAFTPDMIGINVDIANNSGQWLSLNNNPTGYSSLNSVTDDVKRSADFGWSGFPVHNIAKWGIIYLPPEEAAAYSKKYYGCALNNEGPIRFDSQTKTINAEYEWISTTGFNGWHGDIKYQDVSGGNAGNVPLGDGAN